MGACGFCGVKSRRLGQGRVCLCANCREEAAVLAAEDPRYVWTMRAVKRMLFGEEKSVGLSCAFVKKEIQ